MRLVGTPGRRLDVPSGHTERKAHSPDPFHGLRPKGRDQACDLGAACRNRTDDLLITRSFRVSSLSAAAQVKSRVLGLSVPVNDRYGGSVLARIWHGCHRAGLSASAGQTSVNPCFAKSIHGVQHGPWPGLTRFVSPSKYGGIQARGVSCGCQSSVSPYCAFRHLVGPQRACGEWLLTRSSHPTGRRS